MKNTEMTQSKMVRQSGLLTLMGLVLSMASPSWAHGADQGFRWDSKSLQCVNQFGVPGRNQNYTGECGELWGADLKKAELARAKLDGANLPRADLSGADLSGASLKGAILMMTKLSGANLEGAIFNERTVLPFSRAEAIQRGMVYVPSSGAAPSKAMSASNEKPAAFKKKN